MPYTRDRPVEFRRLAAAPPAGRRPVEILRRSAPGQGGRTIKGYAAVFDQRADIGGQFFEVVRKGAFARAIRERQDVRALFNHDSNYVLGRTLSGTLRMREDAIGLAVEIDLPETSTAEGLVLEPMRRGDITGMSFAFRPAEKGMRLSEDKATGRPVRELLDVDLYDVSVVTYPAYDGTSISARSGARRIDPGEFRRVGSAIMRFRLAELQETR